MYGQKASQLFDEVRAKRPLVHHITNYVTVNDCANIAICTGAAPVMADAHEEMEAMVAISSALVLNIGTLNDRLVDSMLMAGKAANKKGIPVIVDPVGAGATVYRTKTVELLLDELKVSILKGNAGEIATMAGSEAKVVGVDSHGVSGDPVQICRDYASSLNCTVVMTGPQDIISDGKDVYTVDNGHVMMEAISGTGCMASSVVAAFSTVSDDKALSSAAALSAFGLAGEKASLKSSGPMSFKCALFDSLAALRGEDLIGGARIRRIG